MLTVALPPAPISAFPTLHPLVLLEGITSGSGSTAAAPTFLYSSPGLSPRAARCINPTLSLWFHPGDSRPGINNLWTPDVISGGFSNSKVAGAQDQSEHSSRQDETCLSLGRSCSPAGIVSSYWLLQRSYTAALGCIQEQLGTPNFTIYFHFPRKKNKNS